MCGILALLLRNNNTLSKESKQHMLEMARKIRHRGPDDSGSIETETGFFLHERLSIIDPFSGCQPIYDKKNKLILVVNGEIYNYKELREKYNEYEYQTGSDCEVIIAIYAHLQKNEFYGYREGYPWMSQHNIYKLFEQLDGQFSFILHDMDADMTLVGRDPYGITPLYYGIDKEHNILFASEMKSLKSCINVFPFDAGHYMYFCHKYIRQDDMCDVKCRPYFEFSELNNVHKPYVPLELTDLSYDTYDIIRQKFEKAVHKRLMADVPFGVLLSGGLDSSLVASITQRFLKANPEFNPYFKNLNSFSIGLKGSPDLVAAQKVADFIGTKHHSFTFTLEEGINALKDVIYHLETYDITTIRASTPMYLLSRKVKSLGIKMVLSGEGSDELLGGYLYFHKAPNDEAHQMECKRRLLQLGYFDCLRANKSTMAWGLEARTPFLDKEFVDYCINLPREMKGVNCYTDKPQMEKHCLRKAFDVDDDEGNPVYLPSEILWRQKEQFSDGVGYGWIDHLKDYTQTYVEDHHFKDFCMADMIYPHNTPDTEEAFYYRMIFEELFPNRETTVKKWVPMTDWEGVNPDPSGRHQEAHFGDTSEENTSLIDTAIKTAKQGYMLRKQILGEDKKDVPNYNLPGLKA